MTPTPNISKLAADRTGDRPLVLLIDDNQDVHRLLRARLRSEAIELVSASDGVEGLEMVAARPPAIVLLDLDMPRMDGFTVLRNLKEMPETTHIPVIVLSGLDSPHDKVTAFDLGAIDYITKPFEMTELRVRVRSALRLYELMRMLAQRAQIDGLTGLWNRAHFDERWTGEVERANRHGNPLSVAMIDLDHFKGVNDTFGHPAGDAVLKEAARVFTEEARASDIVCRYGGEEFALIMPETAPQDALILCERIRQRLEAMEWAHHPASRITLSCGVAGAERDPDTGCEAWIETADRALYASKKSGRNRTTVTDLATGSPLNKAG